MRSRSGAFLAVLALTVVAGCSGTGGWNMPSPQRTGVRPLPGWFHPYHPNGAEFRLVVIDSGPKADELVVEFTRDYSRFDHIPIVNGGFAYEWGRIGAADCPADAYAISGWFTGEDRARVYMKWGDASGITGSGTWVLWLG